MSSYRSTPSFAVGGMPLNCACGSPTWYKSYEGEFYDPRYKLRGRVCRTCFMANLGTPISQLSGRPGHEGFERFAAIGRSWGYP